MEDFWHPVVYVAELATFYNKILKIQIQISLFRKKSILHTFLQLKNRDQHQYIIYQKSKHY